MIYKAIDLAKEAHKTQKRKDGSPYIEHPARVVHLLCLHESDFYTRYLAESVELYNSLTKIHNTRLGSIFNSLLGDNE